MYNNNNPLRVFIIKDEKKVACIHLFAYFVSGDNFAQSMRMSTVGKEVDGSRRLDVTTRVSVNLCKLTNKHHHSSSENDAHAL